MFDAFINTLKDLLIQPLPGEQAQFQMAPQGRLNFIMPDKLQNAAVLILLYPMEDKPWLVLMKRPEYEGVHSGQVSLPGGKYEVIDENMQSTALRETSEELGIPIDQMNIIGNLSCLKIPVSGFEVYPFVGFLKTNPKWKPDKVEVAKVIETPLNVLIQKSTIKTDNWILRGNNIEVPYYSINGEKIWGATAMILSEFVTILKNNESLL